MIVFHLLFVFFFFKHKTAYEMRISDWSSDVCSSDLHVRIHLDEAAVAVPREPRVARDGGKAFDGLVVEAKVQHRVHHARHRHARPRAHRHQQRIAGIAECLARHRLDMGKSRSEEHTSELQSLMRISYAVFCLKKKKKQTNKRKNNI